ncbi:MAG: DUF1592 domain-containing protein [Myxococcota bacterium]
MRQLRQYFPGGWALLGLLLGCQGLIVGDDAPAEREQEIGPPPLIDNTFACAEPSAEGLPAELRRLSSRELEHTLEDTLGRSVFRDVEASLERFPADGIFGGAESFQNAYTYDRAKASVDIASAIADTVVDSADYRTELLGNCAGEADVAVDCVRSFVSNVGKTLFRRPLADAEIDTYSSIYEEAGRGNDGLKATLMGLLVSPHTLYHVERGVELETAGLRLTDYEVAARIGYQVTEGPPDAELFAAAVAGELTTVEAVRAQVHRLLDTERGRARMANFFAYWFDLDYRPGFSQTSEAFRGGLDVRGLETEANAELEQFLEHAVFDNRTSFEALMTSPYFFAESDRLASIYGAPVWDGEASEGTLTRESRRGILGRLVVLGSGHDESDPILRGVFVRQRLLCDVLNPPDAVALSQRSDQVILDPEESPKRERVARFTQPAECMACHSLINPIGFALEDYDGLGRYRTEETVFDDSGEIIATHPIDAETQPELDDPGDERTVASLDELSALLGASDKASACLSRHWFRYSTYRNETVSDSCQLREVHDALRGGDSLIDAFVASIAQPRIFYRQSDDGPSMEEN